MRENENHEVRLFIQRLVVYGRKLPMFLYERIRIREFETSQEEEIREEEGRIDRYRKEMRGRGRGKGWEGRQNVEKLKNQEYGALYVTRTQNCVLY